MRLYIDLKGAVEIMKEPKNDFVAGKELFTLRELLDKAAELKGMKVLRVSHGETTTEPIAEFVPDAAMLRHLREQGMVYEENGDMCYLRDDNAQPPPPFGFASSVGWSFKRKEDGRGYDFVLKLHVSMKQVAVERGILLWPIVYGTCASACDSLPNYRLFKALIEGPGAKVPDVAREIVQGEGMIPVTWTELGLGGLRSIRALFDEFIQRKQELWELGLTHKVFDPKPLQTFEKPDHDPFLIESAQPRLFRLWKSQLDAYRSRLAVGPNFSSL